MWLRCVFVQCALFIGPRAADPEATMMDAAERRIEAARSDKSLRKTPIDDSFPGYLVGNQDRFRHLLDA
jgi:hypothetical protein